MQKQNIHIVISAAAAILRYRWGEVWIFAWKKVILSRGNDLFHFQQQQKRTYMQTVSQQVISKIEGTSATIRPIAANAVIIAIAAIIQVEHAT